MASPTPRKASLFPLLVTQFWGAFNDNIFKFVISMIAVDFLGTFYLSLSAVIFVLPFMFFSTYAGFLADRFSKQRIIVACKVAELVLMTVALAAFTYKSVPLMMVVLFFMGVHSTVFSPAKYGILPELLDQKRISEANGQLVLWTWLAIIFGQALGGPLMRISAPDFLLAGYFFIFIAVLGLVFGLRVPYVKPSGSSRPIRWNVIGEVFDNLRWIRKDRAIFLSMVGLAYLNILIGVFHLNILLYARKLMNVPHEGTSILLAVLGFGIGVGSVVAGRLSDKKVELGLVPMGAVGLSVFSALLGTAYHSYFDVMVCLFWLGFSCGFYIVPLSSLIQQLSPKEQRGQILGTNNVLCFAALLIGAGILYVLRELAGLDPARIFVVTGVATFAGAIYITSLLPYSFVRFLVWVLAHTIYKIKAVNAVRVPEKGGALLVSNHVSLVDGIMIIVTLQRPVRFLVHRDVYNVWWLKPLMKVAKVIPIASQDSPKEIIRSLTTARDAVRNGELVCIFAEGQLTRTGNTLKFNKGLEVIMKDVEAPVVPVHLDRIWGSIFSFERGKYYWKVPKMIPYPVTVSYGEPMSGRSSAFEIRSRVMELGADSFRYRLADRMTLAESFWRTARGQPFHFCMADSSGQRMTYGMTLISAAAMAGRLKKVLPASERIGVLIPPSIGGALVNIALGILNKVPVNINYTASTEALTSVVSQCGMEICVTSRKFLDKTGIQLPCRAVYVEDLVAGIGVLDKAVAFLASYGLPWFLSHRALFGQFRNRSNQGLATIMFTSGSTGEPKGVMLTHANITSNLEGLYQVFHTKEKDVLVGVLPFFHSFGFTGTLWFPIISGIGAVYHVNPLDAKTVGKLVQEHKGTILMATPTFLNTYLRRCEKEQFQSLRVAIVGAEKLKESLAQEFQAKFGIDPMEGYGCTELSPIVSLNLPDYVGNGPVQKAQKVGTIGLPLPGIAAKILDQGTMQPVGAGENGLLFIKGPNVMKGYLNREEATQKVIQDGWYMTGDIANMDEDGFIRITDRLSRFSKIAGEMVPHIKIEEAIHSILKITEQMCVVASLPDDKKGEKLAVLYSGELDVAGLVEQLKQSGLPNLWIPDAEMFHRIEAIPLLGSGKLDLGAVKAKAKEVFAR